APPVEGKEPLVYMTLQGEDVSVAVAEIARVSGRSIEVKAGIELPVCVAFHGVPWREALREIVEESECAPSNTAEQNIVLVRPKSVRLSAIDRPLDKELWWAAL